MLSNQPTSWSFGKVVSILRSAYKCVIQQEGIMKETNFNNAGRFFPHDVDLITGSTLTTMVTLSFCHLWKHNCTLLVPWNKFDFDEILNWYQYHAFVDCPNKHQNHKKWRYKLESSLVFNLSLYSHCVWGLGSSSKFFWVSKKIISCACPVYG